LDHHEIRQQETILSVESLRRVRNAIKQLNVTQTGVQRSRNLWFEDKVIEVRVRVIALVVAWLAMISTTFAQTSSEVDGKYGKPVPVYTVSEHIWMTPDYAADGQVCRMRLYPRRLGPKTDYLGSELLFSELSQVLNEIVPPNVRGTKKDGFGQTSLGGGTAWTTYEYQYVSFSFIFSYKLDPDVLKKAESKVLTGPDPEGLPLPQKTPPSLDDFAASQNLPTEIVTISWNHRPCPKL